MNDMVVVERLSVKYKQSLIFNNKQNFEVLQN